MTTWRIRDAAAAATRLLSLGMLALGAWLPLAGDAAAGQSADGRLMVDAMEYPWSAIGRVNTGGRGHCTGFLVGPRHVMTAAHCLFNSVEGRWWGANELHFIAGYQLDRFILHAGIAGYERARGYDPRAKPSASAAVDWALLELEKPLGHAAGWLGLAHLDRAALADLESGRSHLLQAGYRAGRAHAITTNGRCRFRGWFAERRSFAHDCATYPGDSGSPILLFSGSHFRAVGFPILKVQRGGHRVGVALSLDLFADGGESQAVRAIDALDCAWCDGRPPKAGQAAAALPKNTIDRLLEHLGYLTGTPEKNRLAAIRAFEIDRALPSSGGPSLALLGHLLAALQ